MMFYPLVNPMYPLSQYSDKANEVLKILEAALHGSSLMLVILPSFYLLCWFLGLKT